MYSLIIICLSNRIQLLKFYFSVITLEPTFTKKNKKTCKNLRILIFNRQNCDAGKDSFKAAKASPVIYVVVVFCLLWYRRTRACTQSSTHKTADFMLPAISPS